METMPMKKVVTILLALLVGLVPAALLTAAGSVCCFVLIVPSNSLYSSRVG